MSSQCNCIHPEGGGTICPIQHLAICIRGKDRECYGECIPIPREFNPFSYEFDSWANDIIRTKVEDHISNNLDYFQDPNGFELPSTPMNYRDFGSQKGVFSVRSRFRRDVINVQYSFSFDDN